MKFETKEDYEKYFSRLNAFQAQVLFNLKVHRSKLDDVMYFCLGFCCASKCLRCLMEIAVFKEIRQLFNFHENRLRCFERSRIITGN